MKIELNIEDADLELAIKNGAEAANLSVDAYALIMMTYSFNTSNATLAVEKLYSLLNDDLTARIMELQMNSFATRHQITNLHADLLGEHEQRALDIATEANVIAEDAIFGNTEEG